MRYALLCAVLTACASCHRPTPQPAPAGPPSGLNACAPDPQPLPEAVCPGQAFTKYGLKCATLKDVLARVGLPDANYFWHAYTIPAGEKAARMREVLSAWRVEEFLRRGGEKE